MHVTRRFHVVGIDRSDYMVRDIARATTFYEDVLGLTRTSTGSNGCEFDLADGATFGLWSGEPAEIPFSANNSILFAVDDLDAAVSHVKTHGIALLEETETPVCRFISFLDSEGNTVTLHKRKT